MDIKTPQTETRLAAGEAELEFEDLPIPQHCGQLSTKGSPAFFPFLSLCTCILRRTLVLKSSSAPASAASSFNSIDNAISCCVTGWMLTITDEQERKDVPQVLLRHRMLGTLVRTAQGMRRKDWERSRGHPCSAITVTVRETLHWHTSFLLPTNQIASPSFSGIHLNKLPHSSQWHLLFKKMFETSSHASSNWNFPGPEAKILYRPILHCTFHFITGKHGPYGVVNEIWSCSYPHKVDALGVCDYLCHQDQWIRRNSIWKLEAPQDTR